jgi:hypothetical protein
MVYLGIDVDDEYLQSSAGNGKELNVTESVLSRELLISPPRSATYPAAMSAQYGAIVRIELGGKEPTILY